uniref:Uncharacterized protein n=1 Tax=Rhizophora mucronata TaxID=61149 RepID=A0A2P2R1W8_RHIMU
MTSLCFLVLIG